MARPPKILLSNHTKKMRSYSIFAIFLNRGQKGGHYTHSPILPSNGNGPRPNIGTLKISRMKEAWEIEIKLGHSFTVWKLNNSLKNGDIFYISIF
jgi:hypothetical protein